MKPNLFTHATSELSQDAFILWLLEWANPKCATEDKALHETAQEFVRLLLENKDLEIHSVDCKKQEHHIDVFAIVNEKYALIIEDKTYSSEHSNQVERYSKWVKKHKEYSKLELHCVYFKTGNESLYKLNKLAEKYDLEHFTIVTRKDVLNVLHKTESHNAILRDYVDHLQNLQDRTNSYLTLPITDWKSWEWQGFYMSLETELGSGDWGYVANPNGGFWGFWWHWKQLCSRPEVELYLQFEQNKLCVKAYNKNAKNDGIQYSNKLIKFAKEKNIPTLPIKRRTGITMTLTAIDLQNFDTLDMPDLIKQLREIENFLDEASRYL